MCYYVYAYAARIFVMLHHSRNSWLICHVIAQSQTKHVSVCIYYKWLRNVNKNASFYNRSRSTRIKIFTPALAVIDTDRVTHFDYLYDAPVVPCSGLEFESKTAD